MDKLHEATLQYHGALARLCQSGDVEPHIAALEVYKLLCHLIASYADEDARQVIMNNVRDMIDGTVAHFAAQLDAATGPDRVLN